MKMMNMKSWKTIVTLVGFFMLAQVVVAEAAQESAESPKKSTASGDVLDYIAIVGDERIGMTFYIGTLRKGIRERFYHGKAPEAELKKYRKEVAENLVDRQLAIQEARRRAIKPDLTGIAKAVEHFDQQFKDDPEWPKAREQVLKQLEEKLRGDSLAKKLEEQARKVPAPKEAELSAYYREHKDLFTTPERVRVSLILLKVDPSSPSAVWQQASEEANTILSKINKGADFAELASIHSADDSAKNGGDMGYIHSGMLGVNAQKVLDIMETGEISAPVVLLEGVALFRLEDREKPVLNPLESVKERAVKLYQRDKSEQAWKDLMTKLRSETKIKYNDAPWR